MKSETTLTELKKLAEAATRGPWGYCYDGSSDWSVGKAKDPQGDRVCSLFRYHAECPDAPFIAAADPTTILALIDDLIAARNQLREIQHIFQCGASTRAERCLAAQKVPI